MVRRIITYACLLALCCTVLALPSSSRAGSKFGLNLLGERLDAGDARSIALGGDLQIVSDSLGVLQRNPAALMFCNRVTIGTMQYLSTNRGKSNLFTETEVSVKYPTLMFAVPLSSRIVFGFGYRGKYDPGAAMAIEVEEEGVPTYKQIFTKSGGLYSVPLTIAVSPASFLFAGAYLSLERGSIEDRWDIHFKDDGYNPSVGVKKYEFSAYGYGGGIILNPRGSVMLGVNYESGITYDTDISEKYTQAILDTTYSKDIELPQEIDIAVAWRVGSGWNLYGSAGWRDFTEFKGYDVDADRLYRQERYAVGAEYGAENTFPLRFSLAYERLPYDFPASKRIATYTAGLGSGLILKGGKGKMDVTLLFGKTGSIDENGLEDSFFKIVIGISGSETWKQHGIAR